MKLYILKPRYKGNDFYPGWIRHAILLQLRTVSGGRSRQTSCSFWQVINSGQSLPPIYFCSLLGMENRFENDNDCSIINFRIRTCPISLNFSLIEAGFLYKEVIFRMLKQRRINLLVSGITMITFNNKTLCIFNVLMSFYISSFQF